MSNFDHVELSIVIASFRCRHLLAACLNSLQGVEDEVAVEVIVVDNDSRDGTVELVRAQHPRVQLIEAGSNAGFSAANNIGMAAAHGRFVLLLNPDTVVPPGALSGAVAELARRPCVGMLGVRLVRPDGSLDHACKRGFPTALSALYYFVGLTRLFPTSRRFAQYTAGHVGETETSEVDAVNGAFMLVRREALDTVGSLDEDYWLYMEDLDWCYRFWQAGWKVLYWPLVSVTHVKGGSSGTSRNWRANHAFHRGMWLFYRKNYARDRSAAVNVAIWAGIHAKLLLSAAASGTRRGLRVLRPARGASPLGDAFSRRGSCGAD